MTSIVERLLQNVIRINREYASLAQETKHAFNIFSILRQEDDEVNLHSRFIAELLDPQGTHGMGTAFLERWLLQVELDTFDCATVTVRQEYRNIDVLLTNDQGQAIVIENKIYAPDQPRQLQRYHRTMHREGFTDVAIVYLTLYGDPPSDEGLGKLDESLVTTMSYQDDVRDWLTDCIEVAAVHPVIGETLVQYQRLVEGLTGQAGGRKLMDVKALISDEESLNAAVSISQALLETQIDVQFAFWLSLEEKLSAAGFEITEYWKYSRKSVETYHRRGVHRYGLLFGLPELAGEEIVAFFVGASHRVYYGFVPLEHGSPVSVTRQPGFAVLAEIAKGMDAGWSASPSMVAWRSAQRKFDFHAFNTPDVLALIDSAKRYAYLNELVEEIIVAIEQFYEACESDPRLNGGPEW